MLPVPRLPRNQSQMRPGATSAFYRTKCTECSAIETNKAAEGQKEAAGENDAALVSAWSASHHSPMPDLPECSKGQERCSSCRLIRTAGMLAVSRWRTEATTQERCRPISGSAMSAYRRYASCRRPVSRIFGANDCARTVSELLPNSAPKAAAVSRSSMLLATSSQTSARGTPAQPAL